jgi:hypothetical protein
MLARGVGRRSQIGQKSRRRGGDDEMSRAACGHARYHASRRVHVRYQIHVEEGAPILRLSDAPASVDPGVRAEEVDRPVPPFQRGDDLTQRLLVGNVDTNSARLDAIRLGVDIFRDAPRGRLLNFEECDVPRPAHREKGAERAADAAAASGHDCESL